VNLIGEHTDYNGGFVLPIAIDRWCIAVGATAQGAARSRVLAVDLGESVEADLLAPLGASRDIPALVEGHRVRTGSWASYVLGVAANMAEVARSRGIAPCNVDLAVSSSVPRGSGLSSSAALEVAVATLLDAMWGVGLGGMEKAGLCRRAEHEYAGVPCGIMDQYISAMGREGHALLIDCRAETAEAVPMPPAERAVVVVMNTNVNHELAAGEYAGRRQECRGAAGKLGVPELRDATAAMLRERWASLSAVEGKRARHVIGEIERTAAACDAMRAGDLEALGKLMYGSHESLAQDYEVSCAELDLAVEAARDTAGVFGARMTGGGFGGCAVALAEPGAVRALGEAVGERYGRAFGRECEVFTVRACGGASMLPSTHR